jgi:hypothetical protein
LSGAPIPRLPSKPKRKGKPQARPSFRVGLGPCVLCGTTRRFRQAHHGLPQQVVRRHVEGLRLPEADARRLMLDLLSDVRNRMAVCVECHPKVEHGRSIPRHKVPRSVFEFAAELGERYVARLERMYPLGEHPTARSRRVPNATRTDHE